MTIKRVFLLLILSYVFFFVGNSFVSLTDPDEVFYALTAKEMAIKGEWLTPYIFNQPQFEKPIFTYWLLRVAAELFGDTPFSARFFPALFAAFGVLGVYALGLFGFLNERKAFWSALVLCTGALYVGMGKTVFTDMIFTVFILYSLLSFYLAFSNPRRKLVGISGFYIFAGLAVLTKGPLGFGISAFIVVLFLAYRGQLRFLLDRAFFLGFFLFLLIALPWYLYAYVKYGQAFIQEFFYNDHIRRFFEAEHKSNDTWYFYPITMFLGMFPWSLFLTAGVVGIFKKLKTGLSAFEHFILSWILIVFFGFQFAHSKLSSYILPLFPAMALLIGNFIEESLMSNRPKFIKIAAMTTAGFLFILSVVVVAAHPVYRQYIPSIMPAYFLSASLITLSGIVFTFIIKDRISQAILILGLALLPILWTTFLLKNDLEPYVSSFEACQYLPHASGGKSVILTSKAYARGIRFYTGQDTAVLSINGSNYFSPHPIPILTTDVKLIEFLESQPMTYAILKKSWYNYLASNLPPDKFKVNLIKILGYNYILTVQAL